MFTLITCFCIWLRTASSIRAKLVTLYLVSLTSLSLGVSVCRPLYLHNLCLYTDEQVTRFIHTEVNFGRISSVFTVKIKSEAKIFGELYVTRNFLYTQISLTKDLHDAKIWGTYYEAEQWLGKHRGTETLNDAEVVKVLNMLRKS